MNSERRIHRASYRHLDVNIMVLRTCSVILILLASYALVDAEENHNLFILLMSKNHLVHGCTDY